MSDRISYRRFVIHSGCVTSMRALHTDKMDREVFWGHSDRAISLQKFTHALLDSNDMAQIHMENYLKIKSTEEKLFPSLPFNSAPFS